MSLAALIAAAGPLATEHANFGSLTTYRVGGTVRVLLTLDSMEDLATIGPWLVQAGKPIVVLGNGSNLVVADGEVDVVGIRLGGEFELIEWHDDGEAVVVKAGAAVDLPVAARRLASDGVVGFEWAVGVPGTIGGAVVMNAGGHGSDMAASVAAVQAWRDGELSEWTPAMLHFDYRSSALSANDLVTSATLRLARGDAEAAGVKIREIVRWRREHQPGGANGGSVFRNPVNEHAARLIEVAGCKGLRVGSAVVSEKHANFFLVDGGGRAQDIVDLLVLVRQRVFDDSGIQLESEHRFVGFEVTA